MILANISTEKYKVDGKYKLDGKYKVLENLLKIENFWWKFNRKIEFLTFFGKFLTKNRASENNRIFL